jgi:hypothetical protein
MNRSSLAIFRSKAWSSNMPKSVSLNIKRSMRMSAAESELKSRPDDQRTAVMALYGYPNMQVRLNAAKATLAVAPEAARQVVETIAASTWAPQCYDAGMCLWMLDEGRFVPT